MVVPLSVDPGHNDPKSPLFRGCHRCGNRNAKSTPCRQCNRDKHAERTHAEVMLEKQRKRREEGILAVSVDGDELRVSPTTPPVPDHVLREREPDPPAVARTLREMRQDDRPEEEAIAVTRPDSDGGHNE